MELLNTFISALAILIACISLFRTWNLKKNQAELIKKQLELASSEIATHHKADIEVLLKMTKKGERFIVSNKGKASAKLVNLTIDNPKGHESPICSDFEETFPISFLNPGESASVIAALTMGTGTKFEYIVHWKNPDDTIENKKGIVSLND